MIEPQPGPMSLDDYDRLNPPAGETWELHGGYVVASAIGPEAHGILCTRIAAALDGHVENSDRAFGAATIGVRLSDRATNFVPDGVVTSEAHVGSRTYVLAPKLVVEVLTLKSVKLDRVDKLDIYRSIPSVLEYAMIDSRRVWASVYRRGPGGTWIDVTCNRLEDRLDLLSIDLRIPLAALYRGIDLRGQRRRPI